MQEFFHVIFNDLGFTAAMYGNFIIAHVGVVICQVLCSNGSYKYEDYVEVHNIVLWKLLNKHFIIFYYTTDSW